MMNSTFRPSSFSARYLTVAIPGIAFLTRATLILAFCLSIGLGGTLVAGAADLPDPERDGLSGNERLEALVERVRIAQGEVDSLEARFEQRRESEMLLEAETSNGLFSYVAPDRVRWEYYEPNPISIVVTDEEMVTWYRDLDRAEVMKIGRYSSQIFRFMGAGGSLDQLMQYFSVTLTSPKDRSEPFRLDLKPRFDRVAKRLEGLSIWIDRGRYLPVQLRYVEPGGDVTEYRFDILGVNDSIPAERFVLDLPDEVESRVVDIAQGSP